MNKPDVDLNIENGLPGEDRAERDTQRSVADIFAIGRTGGGKSVAGSSGSGCSKSISDPDE